MPAAAAAWLCCDAASCGAAAAGASPNANDLLLPTTSPVDFEPAEAHATLDRIAALRPARAFLAHFGAWEDVPLGAQRLHAALAEYDAVFTAVRKDAARDALPTPAQGLALCRAACAVCCVLCLLCAQALGELRAGRQPELAWVQERLGAQARAAMRAVGLDDGDAAVWGVLENDLQLNADGLLIAAQRDAKEERRERAQKKTGAAQ